MSTTITASILIANSNGRLFGRLLAAVGIRLEQARARYAASRELAVMSAGELADMGITRHDVTRLFHPQLAAEFRSRGCSRITHPQDAASPRRLAIRQERGNTGRVPDAATRPVIVSLMPQGSAVVASLESQS
jgi:uncharacterized protein YjiS (DUF1127 family)